MRVGVSLVDGGGGGLCRTSAVLLFTVLLALTAGNLQANVILGLGIPSCTAVDTPGGTITPACGATDSQGPAQPNGLTGISFGITGLPLTVSNNNDNNEFRTATFTFSTTDAATNDGAPTTVTAGTVVSFGYTFNISAQNAGPNTLFDSYSLTYDIIDVTNSNTSVFTTAPTTGTVPFTPPTNLPNGTGQVTGQFSGTLFNPIISGHTYTVRAILVVDWDAGNQKGIKNWFIDSPLSFDINPILVPEPSTLSLAGGTLGLLALLCRRKNLSR